MLAGVGLWLVDVVLRHAAVGLGYQSFADQAASPLVLLVLGVFGLILMPMQNAISRRFERQCDRYALIRTGKSRGVSVSVSEAGEPEQGGNGAASAGSVAVSRSSADWGKGAGGGCGAGDRPLNGWVRGIWSLAPGVTLPIRREITRSLPNARCSMSQYRLSASAALLFTVGCHLPMSSPNPSASPTSQAQETCAAIRVKAPPQKIVIEGVECESTTPPAEQKAPRTPSRPERQETAPEQKESRPAETENLERTQTRQQVGEQTEAGLGGLAALGQIAGFSRTMALTSPLGSVNPGSSALGLGIGWIRLPIPYLRLFSVQETPSITVPLNEANLMPTGYSAGYANSLIGAGGPIGGIRQPSRDEIAALVARELAAQRCQPTREERASPPDGVDAATKRQLEKKLSDAEAQIEHMSRILQSLDEKLSQNGTSPSR